MFEIFDPYLDLLLNDRFERFCQTLAKEQNKEKKEECEKIIRKYFPHMFTEQKAKTEQHIGDFTQTILCKNKKAFNNVNKVYTLVVKEHKDLYISLASVILDIPYNQDKLWNFRQAIKYCLFHAINGEETVIDTVKISQLLDKIKYTFPYVDMDDGEDCSLEFFKLIFGYIRMLTIMDKWKEYQNGKQ